MANYNRYDAPQLQRRHFALADIIAGLRGKISEDDHAYMLNEFISRLRATNYAFKSERFYKRAQGFERKYTIKLPKIEGYIVP